MMQDEDFAEKLDRLWDDVTDAIAHEGLYVGRQVLPEPLCGSLRDDALARLAGFDAAGTGRGHDHAIRQRIRTDSIHWLTGSSDAQRHWLDVCESLRLQVNRSLFLGLFSYECHFARYEAGDFYGRHLDAFRGERNRVLTTVTYLNPEWSPAFGGELVIYQPDSEKELRRVQPEMGTLVVFLSEEFPHEVLPASRERLSIAGWYRVNTSTSDRVDPVR